MDPRVDPEFLKDEYIRKIAPYWQTKLQVDGVFIAKFDQNGIITDTEAIKLRNLSRDELAARDELINILRNGSVESFMKFCDLLRKEGKGHLLRELPECFQGHGQVASTSTGATKVPEVQLAIDPHDAVASTSTGATKVPEVQLAIDPRDAAIKSTAEEIRAKLANNQVYLMGSRGLEYNVPLHGYLNQWSILSERNRTDLSESHDGKTAKMERILRYMEKRPEVEWILLAKAFIETGQHHHLEKIGISISNVNGIDEEYCVDRSREYS